MSKDKAQARRETLARMRAEQKAKERKTALMMWGGGGLVILLLVGLVGFYLVDQAGKTSLDAVTSAKYPGSLHVQTKVSYKENPPMGGEHHPAWQNCGIYDAPINNENAVHSMEHGAVWITYQPDLPKDQVDVLKELASKDYMLLSPYPGLPAKVVVSSWNKQLKLDGADDPRLPKFIAKFKQGPETPELGASCDSDVTTTTAEQPIPTASPSPSDPPHATPTAIPSPSATPTS
ncbi:DUF3105 domain-containing protein [Planomonospora sp. ID91781]|uniref:Membrane protein n=1 Tax=Planomonospora sphaerica TaxID=161355 RepID=A0A161LU83_9ACTN|nr:MULTISPECIES: DUF3105 domain-containing protein [Planomonospora]MBG0821833.1 DUF3105 domain-containing protein [Planomonospora sp. ID91781]GAT65051.1 membrane protein [Planomonospora sphaerica]